MIAWLQKIETQSHDEDSRTDKENQIKRRKYQRGNRIAGYPVLWVGARRAKKLRKPSGELGRCVLKSRGLQKKRKQKIRLPGSQGKRNKKGFPRKGGGKNKTGRKNEQNKSQKSFLGKSLNQGKGQ